MHDLPKQEFLSDTKFTGGLLCQYLTGTDYRLGAGTATAYLNSIPSQLKAAVELVLLRV